jgi:hypothetical protein
MLLIASEIIPQILYKALRASWFFNNVSPLMVFSPRYTDKFSPLTPCLSETRLYLLQTLHSYLTTRDDYRAERDGLLSKSTSLNMSTIRLLPVGSSWKMLKLFCFITYDKYAHGCGLAISLLMGNTWVNMVKHIG